MKTPSPEALYQEALALLKQGQLSPAKARLDVLAKIAPKQSIVQQQLGLIAQKQLRTKDAVKAFSRAVRLAPGDTRAVLLLSDALVSDGQVSEAITLLRKVRHAHPKLVDAHAKLGHALQLAGLFDAASDALMDAISLAPNETQLYRIASVSYNFTQDDPLIAQMERLFRTAADGSPEISNLGFALAKAMEDIKAYDRVFGFLRPANESVRTRFPYSASARREEIQSVQTAFEAARIGTFGASENPVSPIFVTGLPRSGTTLIEQILAAHPDVTGVGEPGFAHRLGRSALGLDAANIVPFDQISTKYHTELSARFPGLRRAADKSIMSYMVMGVLHAVMPEARFLIVDRDPRDNLLSIYRNSFGQGAHRYAYDFDDLVVHRRSMLDMIDYWEDRLDGRIAHVSYETLVANPEPQAKALVASAGLTWDPACLDFYKRKGTVTSLSVAQVRQPIYRSSTEVWRRYGTAVDPLIEALEKDGQI